MDEALKTKLNKFRFRKDKNNAAIVSKYIYMYVHSPVTINFLFAVKIIPENYLIVEDPTIEQEDLVVSAERGIYDILPQR